MTASISIHEIHVFSSCEEDRIIQNPKSGMESKTVYIPRKILVRLSQYIQGGGIGANDRIFPISYVAAWSMVKKSGESVGIDLKPHDLRRHADLSTTQR